jgi:hypothetical protein
MWFYKESRIQKGKDALTQAGFINVKLLRTGERMDCLVEAQKPV